MISPWMPPCCRFTPTCSAYAVEAIQIHGVVKGLVYAVFRLLRCNPFCREGYDPVPPPKQREKTGTPKHGKHSST